LTNSSLDSIIEAILFASGDPVKAERVAAVTGYDLAEIYEAADRLHDTYEFEKRGIRLVRLESSLQLVSAPEHHELIQRTLEARKPPKLSSAALEVLAIVTYEQPVTRAQIDQIRGVDSSYTVSTLTERGLIETAGRLESAPGRPMLYRTTDLFLRSTGFSSLEEVKAYIPSEQISIELKEPLP